MAWDAIPTHRARLRQCKILEFDCHARDQGEEVWGPEALIPALRSRQRQYGTQPWPVEAVQGPMAPIEAHGAGQEVCRSDLRVASLIQPTAQPCATHLANGVKRLSIIELYQTAKQP